MSRAITPDLEPAVLAKYGEGWGSRKIADWLKEAHGVECSHAAVARVVKQTRTVRADVTKTIVREKLGKTVLGDVDALEASIARLEAHAARLDKIAAKERKTPAYLKLVEQLRKVTETLGKQFAVKLHFAGADTPDDALDSASVAEQSFNSRMAGLADRLRKAGVVLPSEQGRAGGT